MRGGTAPRPRSRSRRLRLAGAATAAVLLAVTGAACGDDGDEEDAQPTGEEPTATTAGDAAPTGGGRVVTVSAVDYAFEDLPASVPAGTTLELVNESETEAHELVAFRLPDDETRSAEELAALPPDEQATLFTTPPTAVLVAPPGEEATAMVGDGTLDEPGRYVVVCSIPTGADPDDVMATAAASDGGPPDDIPGGPPHLAHGMLANLTVEP